MTNKIMMFRSIQRSTDVTTENDDMMIIDNMTDDTTPPAGIGNPTDAASAAAAATTTGISDNFIKNFVNTVTGKSTRNRTDVVIDELLSREVGHLSLQEKQNLEDEIHGFYSRYPISDGTSKVADGGKRRNHYVQFQKELDLLPPDDKQAYLCACLIQAGMGTNNHNNSMVISSTGGTDSGGSTKTLHVLKDEYWLRFIRTTVYDIKKAVIRYCKWLDLIVDCFGEIVLTRPIFLSDLDEDSSRFLRKGEMQLLPGRDRSGRRIVVIHIDAPGSSGDERKSGYLSLMKASAYMNDVLSQDETSSRHGAVAVVWPSGFASLVSDPCYNRDSRRHIEAIPIRYSAVHLCLEASPEWNGQAHENTILRIMFSLIMVSMTPDEKMVTKLHTGSRTENDYHLENKFGFPVKDIPITCTGQIKLSQWKQWLKFRQTVDEKYALVYPSSGVMIDCGALAKNVASAWGNEGTPVECPDLSMVVFRNGGTMFHHPPNKVFRSILTGKEEDREQARTNKEKQAIVSAIIQEARTLGFNFCRWDSDKEYYVKYDRTGDDEALRAAVAVALRDNTKPNRARRKARMDDAVVAAKTSQTLPPTTGRDPHIQISVKKTTYFRFLERRGHVASTFVSPNALD